MRISIFLCLLFVLLIPCQAGRLGDFEDDATKSNSSSNSRNSSSHHSSHRHDDYGGYWEAELIEAVATVFVFGGRHSYLRMQAEPYEFGESSNQRDDWNFPVDLREPGEPTIPILKLESAFWYDNSDLYATTTRFETGYGFIGFQANNSYFRESNPTDEMNLLTWHLLYRMSFSKYFEVDMGFGYASLTGDNENTGTSFALPIRVHTGHNWGIEYKPEWININGNRVADYDWGFYYNFKHGSVIAGYRKLETKYQSVEGPYIGVALRF